MPEKLIESLSRDMKPVGLLMIEHRVIERMIEVLDTELRRARESGEINAPLVRTGIDFIRQYADRTHHGKEEDILFRDLEDKDLKEKHRKIMSELVEEHRWGRRRVGELERALEDYQSGNAGAMEHIIAKLGALVDFYPDHIEKEDKHFFLEVIELFSEEEQSQMLREMRDFDSKMIHVTYEAKVSELE